ncbi:MAG TPA: endonuclease domain-containing protein [Herbaspirillum sp.]|nr:endonuclease domain-containing protein [Herbaspirillum sp.]
MTDDEKRIARRAYNRAWREANKVSQAARQRTRIAAKTAEERAKDAAYQRAYRAANLEQLKAKGLAWREKNAEHIKEKRKAYKATRRQEISAKQKAYHQATKEIRKEALAANALKQNRKRPALLLARQEAALNRKKPDICDACGGNDGGIVFDHCHQAMFPRGWLCDRCNVALGCLRDSPERLRQLVAYLERNETGITPEFMIAGRFASRYRTAGSRRHVVVEDDTGHSLTRIG